jgi:ribosome-associated protein
MEEFKLGDNEFVELKNLLKLMDLCASGGEAMSAISEGLVTVNGQMELRKRCKIRTGQIIEFQGQKIIVK